MSDEANRYRVQEEAAAGDTSTLRVVIQRREALAAAIGLARAEGRRIKALREQRQRVPHDAPLTAANDHRAQEEAAGCAPAAVCETKPSDEGNQSRTNYTDPGVQLQLAAGSDGERWQ
jgi:hypothetical protein